MLYKSIYTMQASLLFQSTPIFTDHWIMQWQIKFYIANLPFLNNFTLSVVCPYAHIMTC